VRSLSRIVRSTLRHRKPPPPRTSGRMRHNVRARPRCSRTGRRTSSSHRRIVAAALFPSSPSRRAMT
jgi:hypothetical protein